MGAASRFRGFIAAELVAALKGKRADDLLFTMPGGSLMRLSNWRGATFGPARDRAGISARFRIHTCGTLLPHS